MAGELTQEQKIVHLLNRTTFGPMGEEVSHVQNTSRKWEYPST
jgi:hypothetical protein